jgi:hypothetical protein
MSRPGFALWPETEFKFIDSLLGESYIAIAKPLIERGEKDAVEVRLEATTPHGKVTFRGLPNDQGFLGKFEVELMASSFADAEAVAYGSLAPFLSSWALHLDIPVNIHTIQVTELSTSIHSVRARMPHTEMTFAGGVTPHLTDEFCHYASVYREGMNSNSSFYRFLCFFKIIESIVARRARMNADRAAAGLPISRVQEFMPSTNAEAQKVLEQIYPWKRTWNDVNFDELFPAEVRGKKIGNVADKI